MERKLTTDYKKGDQLVTGEQSKIVYYGDFNAVTINFEIITRGPRPHTFGRTCYWFISDTPADDETIRVINETVPSMLKLIDVASETVEFIKNIDSTGKQKPQLSFSCFDFDKKIIVVRTNKYSIEKYHVYIDEYGIAQYETKRLRLYIPSNDTFDITKAVNLPMEDIFAHNRTIIYKVICCHQIIYDRMDAKTRERLRDFLSDIKDGSMTSLYGEVSRVGNEIKKFNLYAKLYERCLKANEFFYVFRGIHKTPFFDTVDHFNNKDSMENKMPISCAYDYNFSKWWIRKTKSPIIQMIRVKKDDLFIVNLMNSEQSEIILDAGKLNYIGRTIYEEMPIIVCDYERVMRGGSDERVTKYLLNCAMYRKLTIHKKM